MDKLRIDFDQLDSSISVYTSSVTELEEAFQRADQAIDCLKSSEWESDASEEFFRQYDDSWKENMQRQMDLITHLEEALQYAKGEYETLHEKFKKVGNCL